MKSQSFLFVCYYYFWSRTGFVGVIYLDSSQHACGGHTEVQIG